MKKIVDGLNRLFEARTLPEFFEIAPDVWKRMQEIARTKDFILTDYELRTFDGKTLVDFTSDDSLNQILIYLNLEDLKNEPMRTLNLQRLSKTKAYPRTNMYNIKIEGDLGADELPDEDEIKEILTANLAPVDGKIQGDVKIAKQDNSVFISFSAITKEDEEEVKRFIQTNFDKILAIKNVEVERK